MSNLTIADLVTCGASSGMAGMKVSVACASGRFPRLGSGRSAGKRVELTPEYRRTP